MLGGAADGGIAAGLYGAGSGEGAADRARGAVEAMATKKAEDCLKNDPNKPTTPRMMAAE
jgi:hypothetical protein